MIKIKVPASTANLGPGFDTLGAALTLYNTFYVEEAGNALKITGCPDEFANEDNLVYKAMKYTAKKFHRELPRGIKLQIDSQVPLSRGLGSSSTCIVAGIFAAKELLCLPLSKEDILLTATEIEGHPDNVAPAILGGIVTAVSEQGKVYYDKVPLARSLKIIALIPDFQLSTSLARGVLPDTIPRSHGVFNVSRVSLLVTSLVTGNLKNLSIACEDRLHQPYRARLIPDYELIVNKAKDLNASAVFLSGAGPTILVLTPCEDDSFSEAMSTYLKALNNHWTLRELQIDFNGTEITQHK